MKFILWLSMAAALAGCALQQEAEWTPVLEETSIGFLYQQVDRALQASQGLQKEISERVSEDSEEKLKDLRVPLLHLKYYYLPMLEAREHVYNAYRLYYLKQHDKSLVHLRDTAKILEGIGQRGNKMLKDEMEKSIGQVTDVEQMIAMDDTNTARRFQDLLLSLDLKALRGELILTDTAIK